MEEGMLIGEVCRLAKCTPRMVRHYEAEGLIASLAVTAGGRKLYGNDAVSVIRAVRVLKRIGASLKEIRRIMNLTKSRGTKNRMLSQKLRSVLSDAIANMDDEIKLISDSRKKMKDLLQKTCACETCSAEDCKDCSKLEKLRSLGLMVMGTNKKSSL